METPYSTVPTDNLYKFMALGGLVTLLFFTWFVDQGLHTVYTEQQKLIGEYALKKVEMDYLGEDVTNWAQRLVNIHRIAAEEFKELDQYTNRLAMARTNQLSESRLHGEFDVMFKKHQDMQTEFNSIKADYTKRVKEQSLKGAELANRAETLRIDAQEVLSLKRTAKLAGLPVFIFTLWGFYLWYVRVQVYQDRILRKEAEERAPKIKRPKPS